MKKQKPLLKGYEWHPLTLVDIFTSLIYSRPTHIFSAPPTPKKKNICKVTSIFIKWKLFQAWTVLRETWANTVFYWCRVTFQTRCESSHYPPRTHVSTTSKWLFFFFKLHSPCILEVKWTKLYVVVKLIILSKVLDESRETIKMIN